MNIDCFGSKTHTHELDHGFYCNHQREVVADEKEIMDILSVLGTLREFKDVNTPDHENNTDSSSI